MRKAKAQTYYDQMTKEKIQKQQPSLFQLKSTFFTSIQVLESLLSEFQNEMNITRDNFEITNQLFQLDQNSLNSCFQNFYQRLKIILNYKRNSSQCQNNKPILNKLFNESTQNGQNFGQQNQKKRVQYDEQLYQLVYQMKKQCQKQKKQIIQLNMEVNDKKIKLNNNEIHLREVELKMKDIQKSLTTYRQNQKDLIYSKQNLVIELQAAKYLVKQKENIIQQLENALLQKVQLEQIILKANQKNASLQQKLKITEQKQKHQKEQNTKLEQMIKLLNNQLKQKREKLEQSLVKLQIETQKKTQLQKIFVKNAWLIKNDKSNKSQIMKHISKVIEDKMKDKILIEASIKKQIKSFAGNISKIF